METQPVIEGWRGVAVSVGLGTPFARATCAAVCAGVGCYACKFPRAAFRQDGSMRPHKSLSVAPDATSNHFLLMPLALATTVYLFT